MFIRKYLNKNSKIIDIGCGNGKDSYFFGKLGYEVFGIDISSVPESTKNCNFSKLDINNLSEILKKFKPNVVYSRFSLHSIDEDRENKFINDIRNNLKTDDYVMIEARSIKDPLCGVGKKVGENAYIGITAHSPAHYRRFIDINKLSTKLQKNGFNIVFQEESNGFAPYKDEDPVCIRIIAQKRLII